MANWSNEAEAREQIKALVAEYYHDFKEKKADFKPGDRVTYASRVFDEKEMCALTDATLDFWLTTGRFADEFEKEFAKWIGVKFANLVNSGSSANLVAFMALTFFPAYFFRARYPCTARIRGAHSSSAGLWLPARAAGSAQKWYHHR